MAKKKKKKKIGETASKPRRPRQQRRQPGGIRKEVGGTPVIDFIKNIVGDNVPARNKNSSRPTKRRKKKSR